MTMKKMQKSVMAAIMMLGLVAAPVAATVAAAQDAAPAAQQSGGNELVDASGKAVDGGEQKKSSTGGFMDVVFGSGVLGVILWAALFGDGAAAIYFAMDCWVLIKPQKLMPQTLIANVQGAMAEGDVVKALKACESEPSPMANILAAAFQHVEEQAALCEMLAAERMQACSGKDLDEARKEYDALRQRNSRFRRKHGLSAKQSRKHGLNGQDGA